jgi:hypothetical protein
MARWKIESSEVEQMTQGDSISRLTKDIDDFLRDRVAQQPDYLFSCWISQVAALAIKRGYTKDHLLSEIAFAFDKGDGR